MLCDSKCSCIARRGSRVTEGKDQSKEACKYLVHDVLEGQILWKPGVLLWLGPT
jgi:hypothetical protein